MLYEVITYGTSEPGQRQVVEATAQVAALDAQRQPVAMEGATLTTVLLVSLYRTPASLEAAWKYFILCGVGLAQALFGTILLYFAAEKLLGAGGGALLWTELNGVKENLEPTVLSRNNFV